VEKRFEEFKSTSSFGVSSVVWTILENPYRFKRVGRYPRRPSATNGVSIPRRDEESACAHKLDDSQLSRKAPVESTTVAEHHQRTKRLWHLADGLA
jgi:hypothetical protein